MKLRIERDALFDAVAWVSRTIPARPTTPLLSGILMQASDEGSVTMSVFDYETSAQLTVPAAVDEPGTTLVTGKLLTDITKALPGKPVDLTADDSRVNVTCGSSRFALPVMPAAEYPQLPELPTTTGVVDGAVFADAVAQVSSAASKDDTLPLLTGVRLEISGETMTMIATDRYRLALRELPWRPAHSGGEHVALVRAKTLSDVAKSLGGSDVEISLNSEDGSRLIGFSGGGRQSTSLLLDGDYPKVRSLFPASVPIHAVVSRAGLLEAVRRVALVAERNASVRLNFEGESVILEAGQGGEAQASEAILSALTGEAITVAFNPHFLVDGLTALHTEHVRLSFTAPSKPAVLTGQKEAEGDDDLSFRYLLMPVRFGN